MTCEDCGGPLTGTAEEQIARDYGFAFCQSCIDEMNDEAEAYDAVMAESDHRCEFDPESGRFVMKTIGRTGQ